MQETMLSYLDVEVSLGTRWVSLNDGERYRINADQTRDSSARSWRRVTAESPVLGGNYLIHAVPDMVTEQVGVWIYGQDQVDLADNIYYLDELFSQIDFRMRWTYNDYREIWRCQLPDSSISRGQIWTHNAMSLSTFSVPHYPNVTRERLA